MNDNLFEMRKELFSYWLNFCYDGKAPESKINAALAYQISLLDIHK